MAKKSKAIVKSSTALTGSVSKARKELVLRGLTALSKDSEEKLSKRRVITLRSSYKKLSVSEVQSMPNVSIREKYDYGFYGYSKIIHHYHPESYLTEEVVEDNATGLMWCQSGFRFQVWRGATDWVEDLNSEEGYAGYNDWRLPTLEEAVSLLESNWDDSYIDPVFSIKQCHIWTGDGYKHEYEGGSRAVFVYWTVDFDSGYLENCNQNSDVRPVRSMK